MAKRPHRRSRDKINPNKLKTRDPMQLAIIKGATKANVQIDRKKRANKQAARRPVKRDSAGDPDDDLR